ncbi:MAG TPA: adenylate/guanylate cyclase domain-containing protein [Candidatus Eisenbacteria bacterium]|nr:adenylate/guanylate cyclase domain-containing protein [Candidatus Eisenbacteria bacterium]
MLSRAIKALPFGLLVACVGIVLSFVQLCHELEEDIGLGLLFKLRGPRSAPSEAVVISIDKESADRLNIPENPDKWPRSLHARLVEILSRSGAAVVTFDVHFLEPRVAEDDKFFARAISQAGNVILSDPMTAREVAVSPSEGAFAAEHSIVRIVKPLPLLAESAAATAPFVLPRIPFKVNQYWTFQSEGALAPPPTFPVVAYQLFLKQVFGDFVRLLEKVRPHVAGKLPSDLDAAIRTRNVASVMRGIKDIFDSDPALSAAMLTEIQQSETIDRKDKRLLTTLVKLYGGSNRRYVNYYGPPHTVTTMPYYRALQFGEGNGTGESLDLKGKAVFVGLSERILAERKDSFYTVFSQANGVFIGGVEIAATAFLNLLEDKPVDPIGSHAYLALIVLWGVLAGVIGRSLSVAGSALTIALLSGLYLLAAHWRFATGGTWYPIVIPLFVQGPVGFVGGVLWNYVETNKERQRLRKALAYYVPDDIVDQLARNIVDLKQSGEMVYGACLFADVAGYTTLSEKMTPQQLSDLMHNYFEATFEPVKRHGGMVVNLKGDSFLAIWKAPRPNDELRRQACLAALDVAKAVHRFNSTVENLHLPTRVGVHSGQIFLGNIGAGDHYEYGPTGDTVNTASRMEGLNKHLGTEVLVTEESIANLEGFVALELGKFMLKGKAQPVGVYQLLGTTQDRGETEGSSRELFADALDAFKRGSWSEAREKFHRVSQMPDTEGPARFYLRLCKKYENSPPEATWDGVIALEEK